MEAVYHSQQEAPPALRALPVRPTIRTSDTGLSAIAILTYGLVLSALLFLVIILIVLLRTPKAVIPVSATTPSIESPEATVAPSVPVLGRLLSVPAGISLPSTGAEEAAAPGEDAPIMPKNPRYQSSPAERLMKIKLPEVARTHFKALTEEEKDAIASVPFHVKGRRPQFFKPQALKKGEPRSLLQKRPRGTTVYGE